MTKPEAQDPKPHSEVQHSEAASSSVASLPRFLDPETILPNLPEPQRTEFEKGFEAIEQKRKEGVARIMAEGKQRRMKRLGSKAPRKTTSISAKQSPPSLESLLSPNHKDHSPPSSTRNTEKDPSALSKQADILCAPCEDEEQLKTYADGDNADFPVVDGDEDNEAPTAPPEASTTPNGSDDEEEDGKVPARPSVPPKAATTSNGRNNNADEGGTRGVPPTKTVTTPYGRNDGVDKREASAVPPANDDEDVRPADATPTGGNNDDDDEGEASAVAPANDDEDVRPADTNATPNGGNNDDDDEGEASAVPTANDDEDVRPADTNATPNGDSNDDDEEGEASAVPPANNDEDGEAPVVRPADTNATPNDVGEGEAPAPADSNTTSIGGEASAVRPANNDEDGEAPVVRPAATNATPNDVGEAPAPADTNTTSIGGEASAAPSLGTPTRKRLRSDKDNELKRKKRGKHPQNQKLRNEVIEQRRGLRSQICVGATFMTKTEARNELGLTIPVGNRNTCLIDGLICILSHEKGELIDVKKFRRRYPIPEFSLGITIEGMECILKEWEFQAQFVCGVDASSKARLLLQRQHSFVVVCEYKQQIHAVAMLGKLNMVVDNKSGCQPMVVSLHDQMMLSGIYSKCSNVKDKAREYAKNMFLDLFGFPCSIRAIYKVTKDSGGAVPQKVLPEAKQMVVKSLLDQLQRPKGMKRNAWKKLKYRALAGNDGCIQKLRQLSDDPSA